MNFHEFFQFEEFCSKKSLSDTTVAAEPEYSTGSNSVLVAAKKIKKRKKKGLQTVSVNFCNLSKIDHFSNHQKLEWHSYCPLSVQITQKSEISGVPKAFPN